MFKNQRINVQMGKSSNANKWIIKSTCEWRSSSFVLPACSDGPKVAKEKETSSWWAVLLYSFWKASSLCLSYLSVVWRLFNLSVLPAGGSALLNLTFCPHTAVGQLWRHGAVGWPAYSQCLRISSLTSTCIFLRISELFFTLQCGSSVFIN